MFKGKSVTRALLERRVDARVSDFVKPCSHFAIGCCDVDGRRVMADAENDGAGVSLAEVRERRGTIVEIDARPCR